MDCGAGGPAARAAGAGNESPALGIEHSVSGLVVCVVVLAAAAVYGAVWRRRNGTLRAVGGRGPQPPAAGRVAAPGADGDAAASVPPPGDRAEGGQAAASSGAGQHTAALTAAQLGRPLGSRATLVQFSTAFCAPCRATRRILAEVAGMIDGVAHVEVDAEANLGLVRSLGIHSTPTVFVLGADGAIVRRGTGQPRKPDVIAALDAVPPPGASHDPGARHDLNGGAAGPTTAQAGPGAAATVIGVRGDSPDVPA
jgi:thiol-disulfide isomerase/thioredoxin